MAKPATPGARLTPGTAEERLEKQIQKTIGAQSSRALTDLMTTVNGLITARALRDTAKLYQARTGRSLHNDLQEAFRPWLDTRRDLTEVLTQLGPNLHWHGFVEQLAYAVYSNKTDFSDAKGGDSGTNLGALINAAGYKPGPVVRGRQGLQFQVFKPIKGRALRPIPIMSYRGTEGIRALWNNPLKPETREGMVDTYIGDLTRMGAGYPQYQANAKLIERQAKALGKAVMTGHSLGGGLAQIVTAKLPQYTAECITFAAPGIKTEDAESLKNKKIPTTHHRTEGDVVPVGNSKAAPGTIVTYERYYRAPDQQSWVPELSPATDHNHMPVRGVLNFQQLGRRSPMEQLILDKGASGPTRGDQADKIISVVSGVFPTTQDNVKHVGERSVDLGTTRRVFRANLGYNLLVEYVQAKADRLNPVKMSKAQISRELRELEKVVVRTANLPVSKETYQLYLDMNIQQWEVSHVVERARLKLGQAVEISKGDRDTVAAQVEDLWRAWWPEADL